MPGLTSNAAYVRLNHMFGDIVKGTIGDNDVPSILRPAALPGARCASRGSFPIQLPQRGHHHRLVPRDVGPGICNLHVRREICERSGLLATEYCPREHVVEKVFFNRPEFILTDERWTGKIGRGPADADNMPPTEYCDEHGPGSLTYTLNVTPYPGGMSLFWDVPSENYGFVIYRQDFDSAEFVRLTQEPIFGNQYFDDFQPLPGMTYKYRVTTLNAEGAERNYHRPVEARRILELNPSG